ncbi:DUF4450 domain-containing protein [Formosa sp. A9]|uniref:DUF4450 domain-containing protein n=1 Tax=Formosa sp. A9 TaxID=3442641 RepID=UPI003EB879F2
MRSLLKISLSLVCVLVFSAANSQEQQQIWHDTIRQLHYKPEGNGFKLVNGQRKFNRAIYGTNSGFRLEAGDLPEFAMYMPGMGGNFKLGIANKSKSKWLTACDKMQTSYVPGTMIYEIRDELLHNGVITVQVVAFADREGFITKVSTENLPKHLDLIWAFGGASGKKFHRDGDIGADPESVFYLQPKYCVNNKYTIKDNRFKVDFGSENNKQKTGNNRHIAGCLPKSEVKLANALQQESPKVLFESQADSLPVITGTLALQSSKTYYWAFENTESLQSQTQQDIQINFEKALEAVQELRSRVTLKTPDPYINTLGGALAIAGDAIWESPAYLHGAVAWRMHLNAWRGAYVADPLGWKDRAEMHFKSYGKSQVLEPETGPIVLDSSRNFARQKEVLGTAMFSRGYISRRPNNNTIAHHYDMNSVFVNQLLRHYLWTGDTAFIRDMWPVVKRHLAWEKRNFDADGDGLYDAYACIWASDALQYSGGGVTYASAYNYSANTIAAQIAKILGEDATVYQQEANRIKKAVQDLWVSDKGVFAEYKEALGNKNLHDQPGLWTIYHSLDEGIADGFQAYQMLDYVDREIPHIPVTTDQSEHKNMFLLATSNWQPYTWSVNNVALAENLHASLAYWQGGKPEKGFEIWRNALIESMYYGASPGGFQQLSFYDAIRGELYRDFADPVGMAARSLVEGLFGIVPNAIDEILTITPGFPSDWDVASLDIPNVSVDFERKQNVSAYRIKPNFESKMKLKLVLNVEKTSIEKVTVNGKSVQWLVDTNAVGQPKIILSCDYNPEYDIKVFWGTEAIEMISDTVVVYEGGDFTVTSKQAKLLAVKDPQGILSETDLNSNTLKGKVLSKTGEKILFVQMQQGDLKWWQPVNVSIQPQLEVVHVDSKSAYVEVLMSHPFDAELSAVKINGVSVTFQGDKAKKNMLLRLDKQLCVPGTNSLEIISKDGMLVETFQHWDLKLPSKSNTETIDLTRDFNANITEIFQQQYLSPRPTSPTLQLPTQGIGNWCYPYIQPEIDDSGLRAKAALGAVSYLQNIPFQLPAGEAKNIVFASQWDNYPKSIQIPLKGKASHVYLLMAGTTNPMQTRMVNGRVRVVYTDGTSSVLELKNPENWWPIEQNYYDDGFAFTTDAVKPPRLYLKSGEFINDFKDYTPIKGFSDFGIDGGAATLLDLPLNANKTLDYLEVEAVANDVVIGLMGLTLINRTIN